MRKSEKIYNSQSRRLPESNENENSFISRRIVLVWWHWRWHRFNQEWLRPKPICSGISSSLADERNMSTNFVHFWDEYSGSQSVGRLSHTCKAPTWSWLTFMFCYIIAAIVIACRCSGSFAAVSSLADHVRSSNKNAISGRTFQFFSVSTYFMKYYYC